MTEQKPLMTKPAQAPRRKCACCLSRVLAEVRNRASPRRKGPGLPYRSCPFSTCDRIIPANLGICNPPFGRCWPGPGKHSFVEYFYATLSITSEISLHPVPSMQNVLALHHTLRMTPHSLPSIISITQQRRQVHSQVRIAYDRFSLRHYVFVRRTL